MSVQEIRKARQLFENDAKRLARNIKDWPARWTGEMRANSTTYWIDVILRERTEAIMAAAKVAPKAVKKQPEWKGFVNYVLSAEDKVRFNGWGLDDHDLYPLLAGELAAGYKFTCTFNAQNGTYNASFTCNDEANANAGWCLSAFAPDPYNAMKTLLFKHIEVLGCVWGGEKVKETESWG